MAFTFILDEANGLRIPMHTTESISKGIQTHILTTFMVLQPFGIIRSPRVLVDTALPAGSLSGTTKSPKGLQRCYVKFDAIRILMEIPSAHWHQRTFWQPMLAYASPMTFEDTRWGWLRALESEL